MPAPLPLDVRLSAEPEHIGELPPTVGAAGAGFMTTVCTVAEEVQPEAASDKEYVPALAAVALGMLTFCPEAEKPFGPDHT